LSHELEKADFLALPDRLCGSYRRLFDACQFTQDFPPPYSRETRETSTSPVQSRLTTLRFTRGMSWLRQYLLLQTGTGIDGRQEIPLGDNLIMAHPHASFEDVIQACKAAEIHEVIETLNDGYQTEIGERGTGLSGGSGLPLPGRYSSGRRFWSLMRQCPIWISRRRNISPGRSTSSRGR
jgi:hypothetical protein